jgi:hypothetical protein
MERLGGCLELAALVAWRIDQILEDAADLLVYRFGTEAEPVAARRHHSLDHWQALFNVPAPPVPGTSAGSAVALLAADARTVNRLVIVTDGYENRPPRLAQALERCRTATGQLPAVYLVQPSGSGRQLATDLRNAQVSFHVFSMDQQLLGLDAFISSLLAGTGWDPVAEIMAME